VKTTRLFFFSRNLDFAHFFLDLPARAADCAARSFLALVFWTFGGYFMGEEGGGGGRRCGEGKGKSGKKQFRKKKKIKIKK
jgi:hypothetical protein